MTNKQLIEIIGAEKALKNVLNVELDRKGYILDDDFIKDFIEILTDKEVDDFFLYLDKEYNLIPLNDSPATPFIITRKENDPLVCFSNDSIDSIVICSKKNRKQCIEAINQYAFNLFKFDYTLQRDIELVKMAYAKNQNIFNTLDSDIQNILRGDN